MRSFHSEFCNPAGNGQEGKVNASSSKHDVLHQVRRRRDTLYHENLVHVSWEEEVREVAEVEEMLKLDHRS